MRARKRGWLWVGLVCAGITLGIAARQVLALTSQGGCACVVSTSGTVGLRCSRGATNSGTGSIGVNCPISLGTQASSCVPVTDVMSGR